MLIIAIKIIAMLLILSCTCTLTFYHRSRVTAHNFIAVVPYSAIFPEWDLHYIWKMKMKMKDVISVTSLKYEDLHVQLVLLLIFLISAPSPFSSDNIHSFCSLASV